MRVLIVAPEAVPFAKTGGLADVAGALAKALKKKGVDVGLVIPKYKTVDESKFGLERTGIFIMVPMPGGFKKAEILKGWLEEDIPVYFIKKDIYFDRENLYGTEDGDYIDNAERFIFFSRAVPELCKALNFNADVIHCNDWQTAMVPVYLKTLYKEESFFSKTASVYTVHNMGYQGLFWHFDMHITGLGWDMFTPDGIEFYGKINLMKGGLLFSDVITTVSKAYGREIQTEEFGCGLDGVVAYRKDELYGIVNGIDYDEWNPAKDKRIAANYTVDNIKGKDVCKADLQKLYSLPAKRRVPLIGMISRLADQKGFDLVAEAIDRIMALDVQMVFLGTGDRKYQELLNNIGKKYPEKAGVKIGYNPALAHKIEAGADMFLMPSRYEPCGLNQLYSLKYGTIPIVRATGGLDDTIKSFSPATGNGNGFKFRDYSAEALLRELNRAIDIYADGKSWKKVMQNAMSCDFSWEHSAAEYMKVYRKAIKKVKGLEAAAPLRH